MGLEAAQNTAELGRRTAPEEQEKELKATAPATVEERAGRAAMGGGF